MRLASALPTVATPVQFFRSCSEAALRQQLSATHSSNYKLYNKGQAHSEKLIVRL